MADFRSADATQNSGAVPRNAVWADVGDVADVPPGSVRRVEVAGRVLALVNVDGTIYALDGICPHRGGPLADGRLWRGELECPWHHFRFDPATGANTYPANVYPKDLTALQEDLQPARTYPVRSVAGRLQVNLRCSAGLQPGTCRPAGRR